MPVVSRAAVTTPPLAAEPNPAPRLSGMTGTARRSPRCRVVQSAWTKANRRLYRDAPRVFSIYSGTRREVVLIIAACPFLKIDSPAATAILAP